MNVFECNAYLHAPVFTNRSSVHPLSRMRVRGSSAVPPLAARSCYSATVAAWNSEGVGSFSPMVSVTQGSTRPGPPVIVSSFAREGMVAVTFEASSTLGITQVRALRCHTVWFVCILCCSHTH